MNTRKKLLIELKKNTDCLISGETLSKTLNISRAAVSKHIAVLKNAGYLIESSPKKGYIFKKTSDLLLPDEITEGLKTKVLGRKEIFYFDCIDSTNNKAKELASKGAEEGTLVVAEQQTAGRGRKGRSWFSETKQGICLSLILRPLIPPSQISQMTLMTAVAIAETLSDLSDIDIKIKWPNDILVNGKKLSGILTEMTMEIDAIDYVVVGLGLNVNNPVNTFNDEIAEIATSLFIETGLNFSRTRIIRDFLYWFEKYYNCAQKDGFTSIIKRWKELSDIIGKNVTVDTAASKISGNVIDITGDGILVLKDNHQKTHRIISGDVRF